MPERETQLDNGTTNHHRIGDTWRRYEQLAADRIAAHRQGFVPGIEDPVQQVVILLESNKQVRLQLTGINPGSDGKRPM
jgi:hypothetical protein